MLAHKQQYRVGDLSWIIAAHIWTRSKRDNGQAGDRSSIHPDRVGEAKFGHHAIRAREWYPPPIRVVCGKRWAEVSDPRCRCQGIREARKEDEGVSHSWIHRDVQLRRSMRQLVSWKPWFHMQRLTRASSHRPLLIRFL